MFPEDDRVRLRHMLDAAKKAVRLTAGRNRESLEAEDDPLPDALVRLISVIGEAATGVEDGTRSALGGVPWLDIVPMRHRLIHAYFDIDMDMCGRRSRTACLRSSASWSPLLLKKTHRDTRPDPYPGNRCQAP